MRSVKHVVLIDDNKVDRFVSKRMLKSYDPSILTTYFCNGASGIKYFKELNRYFKRGYCVIPEVVILDINMPEVDGWQVLAAFERMAVFKQFNIEVIMLSSSSDPRDIARSAKSPVCKGYLTKPLNVGKLSEAMTKIKGNIIDERAS